MVLLSASLATLAALAHGLVLTDEAGASWRAWRWLHQDPTLNGRDLDVCRTSILSALGSYAAPVVAWALVAALAAWWMPHALSADAVRAANPNDATGTWIFIFFVPILLLQAGYVVATVVRPEPVRSSFRLEMVAQRDNQWSFIAGLCVALLVLGLHDHLSGPAWVLALALAAFVAVGPASVLLRVLLIVPVLAVGNLFGLSERLEALWPSKQPDDTPSPHAVVSLYENPPWYLRGGRLLQLAWLPLAAMVILQAVARSL